MVSLHSIAENIRRCTKCERWKNRTLTLSGEGSESARIVVVTSYPTNEQDRQGNFFVGKEGELLLTLLENINLTKKDVFVAPLVKCYSDTFPLATEINECKSYLLSQIDLINPELIVLLGNGVIQEFLGDDIDLAIGHGTIVSKGNQKFLATFAFGEAIDSNEVREKLADDFSKIKNVLE
jgi:uracil-DNA glycosylase